MSSAVAGHGAIIAMEKDGDPGGTFTSIAELNGDITIGFMRPMSEVTPHNDTIDSHIPGVMKREAWTFSVNFLDGDGTHDELTGVQKRWIDGDNFGMRFRGVGGGADDDEVIASGHIAAFSQTNPVREGQRTAEITFQPSGVMEIDGTTVGAVGA